jgi:hypothetical protein
MAAHALDNAGINPEDWLQASHALANRDALAPHAGPALIDADDDKILYVITFDLPDTGLGKNVVPPDNDVPAAAATAPPVIAAEAEQRYPQQSRRSALGWQPYDKHAPRITFVQQAVTTT